MKKLAVVLIRNDRRLMDHEGLIQSQNFDHFLILATYPPQWNLSDRISQKRKEFIRASINAFAESLNEIPLHFHESPEEVIQALQENYEVTVFCEGQGQRKKRPNFKRLIQR